LLAAKTLSAIAKSLKTKSPSGKTAKQNNPTTATKMNNSLVSELPTTDSTTALLLEAPRPNPDGDFIYFPKLPGELRQEIWILSLPGPRDILIRLDPQNMRAMDVSDIKEDENPYYRAKACAGALPAQLHVNQESRSVAKIYYELDFKEQTRGRPIYVDFKIDSICFFDKNAIDAFYGRNLKRNWKPTEEELGHMRSAEAKIQSLIIRGWDPIYYVVDIDKRLQRFPNLDRLSYVCRAQDVPLLQRWYRRRQMRKWKKGVERLGGSFRDLLVDYLAEENFQTRFQHLL
jgi:hypothetical protein